MKGTCLFHTFRSPLVLCQVENNTLRALMVEDATYGYDFNTLAIIACSCFSRMHRVVH
ncbi:hypothetical protein [secondary endosymbiont of Ctenarytaina eucalypti]|uniref:hypothetical protein n=1 Tax=secondary endosymbiont of Ctenarytaina eucalypti TaxID=1199245 RepID=UPI0003186C80|nr:hypothetical protein [secondary endosymbiont of Ctenarytaina eucalypti]